MNKDNLYSDILLHYLNKEVAKKMKYIYRIGRHVNRN